MLLGVMTTMVSVPPLEGVESGDGFFFGRQCLEERLLTEGEFLISVVADAAMVRAEAKERCGDCCSICDGCNNHAALKMVKK